MKKNYFTAFLLLGIFLMPASTFACGNKYKSDHSSVEIASTKTKKDCCGGVADHKDKKHPCCPNNGKDSKCICTSYSCVFLVFNEMDLPAVKFDFYNEKQKISHPEASVSSGFSSLYLKPKIG